ncbi:MAG: hypothetical protein JWL70_1160, partial [Acidimicrobiia bacterium]|nr:hypothetical protein [Acidimicrobiia bacterium]
PTMVAIVYLLATIRSGRLSARRLTVSALFYVPFIASLFIL